jgi:hypothetical protein
MTVLAKIYSSLLLCCLFRVLNSKSGKSARSIPESIRRTLGPGCEILKAGIILQTASYYDGRAHITVCLK